MHGHEFNVMVYRLRFQQLQRKSRHKLYMYIINNDKQSSDIWPLVDQIQSNRPCSKEQWTQINDIITHHFSVQKNTCTSALTCNVLCFIQLLNSFNWQRPWCAQSKRLCSKEQWTQMTSSHSIPKEHNTQRSQFYSTTQFVKLAKAWMHMHKVN